MDVCAVCSKPYERTNLQGPATAAAVDVGRMSSLPNGVRTAATRRSLRATLAPANRPWFAGEETNVIATNLKAVTTMRLLGSTSDYAFAEVPNAMAQAAREVQR